MADENEEIKKLKEEIEEMKKKLNKIDDLEKKLQENSEKDKKHHEELKALQEKGNNLHDKSLGWNKMGAFSAPIATVLVGAVIAYLQNKQSITPQQIQPIKKDADDMNSKLKKVIELLEEQNKK